MTGDDGREGSATARDQAAVMASHVRQALDGTMDARRAERALSQYEAWLQKPPRVPATRASADLAELVKARERAADLVLRIGGLIEEADMLDHHLCDRSSKGVAEGEWVPAVRVDLLQAAIEPVGEVE